MGVRITNVDPTGSTREIELVADDGAISDLVVAHGQTVTVDKALAGRAPSGEPGTEDFDAGAGLLAQTAVWALATKRGASSAATDADDAAAGDGTAEGSDA